jgi:hypothetical protein
MMSIEVDMIPGARAILPGFVTARRYAALL